MISYQVLTIKFPRHKIKPFLFISVREMLNNDRNLTLKKQKYEVIISVTIGIPENSIDDHE